MDTILKEPTENRLIGFRQVRKAVNNNQLRCVMIAIDTDEGMKSQIAELCKQSLVPYNFYSSKIEMGNELGLDVACSVCGILKSKKQELS